MILSEFAGAAQSLNGSIVVNPWDSQEVADAIFEAVTMDAETRAENHKKLFKVRRLPPFLHTYHFTYIHSCSFPISVRQQVLRSLLGYLLRPRNDENQRSRRHRRSPSRQERRRSYR